MRLLTLQSQTSRPRSPQWTCCLCCHVRTGTTILGLFCLVLHVVALTIIAIAISNPEKIASYNFPVLRMNETDKLEKTALPCLDKEVKNLNLKRLSSEPRFFIKWMDCDQRCESDIHIAVAVTFGSLTITILLIYGTVHGKPTYLLPFFGLQVLDFFVICLSFLGYFSFMLDAYQFFTKNYELPFQKIVGNIDPELLFFGSLLFFIGTVVVKLYLIGVVWRCYKFLRWLQFTQRDSNIFFTEPDAEALIGRGLPTYDDAIKSSAKFQIFPAPPPTYSEAVERCMKVSTVTEVPAAINTVDVPPSTNVQSHLQ